MSQCPSEIVPFEAARLQGAYDFKNGGKPQRQGDVDASYSADRIAEDKPIRKPFAWRGGLWVCVGTGPIWNRPGVTFHHVYRIVPEAQFEGTATTYREKTKYQFRANCPKSKDPRNDPNGFYHGMTVKHGGQRFVIVGPELTLEPAAEAVPEQQLDLFGAA